MNSTTVRISDTSHKLLGELAAQEGVSMQAILEKALESYRRQRFLEEVNAAYAAARQDREAWEALQQERAAWEGTLADGLDTEEIWTDEGEVQRPTPRKTTS
jgi:predicted transcriptional regulator